MSKNIFTVGKPLYQLKRCEECDNTTECFGELKECGHCGKAYKTKANCVVTDVDMKNKTITIKTIDNIE